MPEIVKTTKYLIFKRYADNRYYVYSAKDNTPLGDIYYFYRWHSYVFEPSSDTIFDTNCLFEISNFLKELRYAKNN